MFKRVTGIVLILVMVLGLAACAKDSKDSGSNNANSNQTSSQNSNGDNSSKDGGSGNEDKSFEYIKEKGRLIVGLDDSFPPMGFRNDSNEIVGFDIDLARAVCEKLGVELVLQPIDWDSKVQELNTKNVDCIWNGLSLTPKNQENMTTTQPYMTNNITLVVRADSPISKFEDMAGKSLAVQSGSAAEETLDADENKVFKASLKEVNGFDEYITAMLDMESGNSDAVLMDSVVANYMIKDLGKNYKVLEGTLLEDNYVVGFRKGDEALRDAVWNALKELKQEGRIAEISSKWFGFDITTID